MLRHRVQMTAPVLAGAEREVEAIARRGFRVGGALQRAPALGMRRLERRPCRREGLADRSAVRGVDGLDRFAHFVQRRRLAEELPLGVGKLVEGVRRLDRGPAGTRRDFGASLASSVPRSSRCSGVAGRPRTATRSRPSRRSATRRPASGWSRGRRAARRARAHESRGPARAPCGSRMSYASGGSPPCATAPSRRTPPAPSASRISTGGTASTMRNRETRARRGAYDLRIVRVDRSGPEDYRLRTGGRGAAKQRARVAGIAELRRDEREIGAGERFDAAPFHAGEREHRLRCAGVADADLQHLARHPGDGAPLGDLSRVGSTRPRRRSIRAASTPWSSAAATSRGPSHTNTPAASRA